MTKDSKVSRELLDGIREGLDKKTVVTAVYHFNFETKSEKSEPRLLALSTWRLFVFPAKLPVKVELSVNYLDIQSIESNKPNQLRLTLSDGRTLYFTALEADALDVDAVLAQIAQALRTTFPSLPIEKIIRKLDISPSARLKVLTSTGTKEEDEHTAPTISPLEGAAVGCDGFSRIYACMCDYHSCTVMDEITWDLDTIFSCKDLHVLRLQDFDHLSPRDHMPLVSALQFSSWFTTLDFAKTKPSTETINELLKVMKRNSSLKHLNLSGAGLKSEYAQKLSTALLSNVSSALVSLNLSGNLIDDKGLSHLCGAFIKPPFSLQHLNLANAGLTVKGANHLGKALNESNEAAAALHTLDLSGNSFKGEELVGLYTFLSQTCVLRELNMADTESPVDSLVASLGKGCMQHLELFNAAGNPYTTRKTREPPASWQSFFANAQSLKTVVLKGTKLSPLALKALLLGLSTNRNKLDVDLDVSSNELRADGANVIGGCIAELKNVCSLDISDNELDAKMHDVLPWFGQNKSLRHLSIGKNFSSLKNRQLSVALDSLVRLIQLDNLALRTLSIADSRLKFDTTVVINALGSNTTLEKIDISGNQFGDVGAKMLAKALAINSTMKTICWDRNGVTAHGLEDVSMALERNFFLQNMPLPVCDISNAARLQPERVQAAVEKMQQCLQRNHGIVDIPMEFCYQLHQSFLVSATEQAIDEHLAKQERLLTRDTVSNGSRSGSSHQGTTDPRHQLELAAKDIVNIRQIMNKLLSVAQQQESKPNLLSSHIGELTKSLQLAFESQMETTATGMLKTVLSDYPYVLNANQNIQSELEAECRKQGCASEELISAVIKRQLDVSVATQLRKKNLQVATLIADAVTDKLLESLFRPSPGSDQVGSKKPPADAKVEDAMDAAEPLEGSDEAFIIVEKPSAETPAEVAVSLDESLEGETTVTSRKSKLYERMRRPQSLIGPGMQLHAVEIPDLDAEPEGQSEVDSSGSQAATSISSGNETAGDRADGPRLETEAPIDLESLTTVGEAPPQLKHVTKGRPRPLRAHAPGRRPAVGSVSSLGTLGDGDDESGAASARDDGVDRFFEQSPAMSASVTTSPDVTKVQGSKVAVVGRSNSSTDGDSPQIKKRSFWPFGGSSKDKDAKEAKLKDKETKDEKEARDSKGKDKETKESKEGKDKEKKSLSNLLGLKKGKKSDGEKPTSEMADSMRKSVEDVTAATAPNPSGRPPIQAKRVVASVKDIPDKHEGETKSGTAAELRTHTPADDVGKTPINVRDIPDPNHRSRDMTGSGDIGEEGAGSDKRSSGPALATRKVIGAAAIPGMGGANLLAEMKAKRQTMVPPQPASSQGPPPKVALRPLVPLEPKSESKIRHHTDAGSESEGAAAASVAKASQSAAVNPVQVAPSVATSPPALPEKPAPATSARPSAPPKPAPKPKPGSRPNTLDGSQMLDGGSGVSEPDGGVPASADVGRPRSVGDEQRPSKDIALGEKTKEPPPLTNSPVAAANNPVPVMRRHKRTDTSGAAASADDGADRRTASTTDAGQDSGGGHASASAGLSSSGSSIGNGKGSDGVGRVQSLRRSLLHSSPGSTEQMPISSSPPGGASRPTSSNAHAEQTPSSSEHCPSASLDN